MKILDGLILRSHESICIGKGSGLSFRPDIVHYSASTGDAQFILDTKYKVSESPSAGDVAQVVANAEAKNCNQAILIYPSDLQNPFNETVGRIRVRTTALSLKGDLEVAGNEFMSNLFESSNCQVGGDISTRTFK